MALLEVTGISKNFGSTHVLQNISLNLEKGEALAIIGSSGSGKTTLLRCLNFLETPDTGVIRVDGKTLWDAADPATHRESEVRKKRLHFGLVFQNFNLFPQYTALQNITLAGEPDILCFDEPTSALDPELTGEVLRVLRDLADQKTTMIIVTHEMSFARDVADRILFMDGGVVVEEGPAHQVIEHPHEERTKQFLSHYGT